MSAAPAPDDGAPISTDALVIGAGPVGLFQVFELGLLGIAAHVVDVLPHPGGQCAELYPDKPIYDIPGLPEVSGRELVERLLRQVAPFKPQFHLGTRLATLQAHTDGHWLAGTDSGPRFLARTVFIAAGAGAFLPKSVKLDGLAQYAARVHHQGEVSSPLAGEQVVILGDDDVALERAIALAEPAPGQPRVASVTLVHRRDSFRAAPATLQRFAALRARGALRFVAGQALSLHGDEDGDGPHLRALDLLTPDGATQRLPLDRLLVLLGLSPRLGPVADWGLALERRQLLVDTEAFRTSAPGIFAVGDINTYPGKKKLLLCGFHEATLAAFGAAALLFPDERQQLQYTTTSTLLQRRLGVGPPAGDA